MKIFYVYFSTALLHILTLETASYKDTEDPFPDDILTPYKDYYRTKRTHRFVRDCQPIQHGNTTHEIFNVSRLLSPGQPFVQMHNFYHEFTREGKAMNVVGHVVTLDDPFRTFSVLEPKEVGGCSKSTRATVALSAEQRQCYVAANGGMFRTKDGKCYGNVFSDGRKVQDSGGVQNANFGIREDGTLVVGYLSEEDVNRKDNPFIQLVSGVVWLLRNGSSYVNESKKAECRDTEETGSMDLFAGVVSARSALGHDNKGRVMMVQVDGKTHHRGLAQLVYRFYSRIYSLAFIVVKNNSYTPLQKVKLISGENFQDQVTII